MVRASPCKSTACVTALENGQAMAIALARARIPMNTHFHFIRTLSEHIVCQQSDETTRVYQTDPAVVVGTIYVVDIESASTLLNILRIKADVK